MWEGQRSYKNLCNSSCTASDQETIYHTPKTRPLGSKEVREGQACALLGSPSHMELPAVLNLEPSTKYHSLWCLSLQSTFPLSPLNPSTFLLTFGISGVPHLCYILFGTPACVFFKEILSYACLCFDLMQVEKWGVKKEANVFQL